MQSVDAYTTHLLCVHAYDAQIGRPDVVVVALAVADFVGRRSRVRRLLHVLLECNH